MKRTKDKMKKAILYLLISALVLQPVSVMAAAKAGEKNMGSYTVSTAADPVTSQVSATKGDLSYFGEPDQDGKVWTDKSVTATEDGNFQVELSALGQQYEATTASVTQGSRASADVVLILDVTGSMEFDFSTTATSKTKLIQDRRSFAMVNAANDAIETIMKANKKNRVSVVTFATIGNNYDDASKVLLPLNSYTGVSDGKYLVYDGKEGTSTANISKIAPASATGVTGISSDVTHGTNSQMGIALGAYQLYNDNKIKDEKAENGERRHPFVLFLTDGDTRIATKNWYDNNTGGNGKITSSNRTAYGTSQSTPEICANTILTAAYQKDKINTAYQGFNKDEAIKTTWFNVAIAVEGSTTGWARAILDPEWVSTSGEKIASDTKAAIAKATTGNSSVTSDSLKAYADSGRYIYTDKDSNGNNLIEYANTKDALNGAFDNLGDIIAGVTSQAAPPIINTSTQTAGGGAVSFTDQLGEGMELKGTPAIRFEGKSYPLTAVDGVGGSKIYKNGELSGLLFTVFGDGKIIWDIPAELLPLYRFKDGKTSGSGYQAANPMQAVYSIGISQGALDDRKELPADYYSNAFDENGAKATASFKPTTDNPYYYHTNKLAGAVLSAQTMGITQDNCSFYYKGEVVGEVHEGDTLNQVFITADLVSAENSPFLQSEIGMLKNVEVTAELSGNAEVMEELKKTIQNCTEASGADEGKTEEVYAFHSGIVMDHMLAGNHILKTENKTESDPAAYSDRFTDGVLAAYLGNNGRLTLSSTGTIQVMVDKEAVKPGDEITYRITVTNTENDILSNVTVTDSLSPQLTDITVEGGELQGDEAVWKLDSLQPGESIVFVLRAKASALADDTTKFKNSATLTADSAEPVVSNEVITRVAKEHPGIEIAAKDKALPGETFTYTVTVENSSSDLMKDAVISAAVPLGLTFGSASDGGSIAGGKITWNIDQIPAHMVKTLTFTVTVPGDAREGTVYTNQATVVRADGSDLNRNSQEVTTAVELPKYTATVNLNKDKAPWKGETVTLSPDGGTTFIEMTDAEGVYTGEVKDGSYTIYIGNESTGQTIEIQKDANHQDLDYYTLTLKKDTGIDRVPLGGVYLKGAAVSATGVTASTGYSFKQWTSSDKNLLGDQTEKNLSFSMPEGTLTLTATASPDKNKACFDGDGGKFADGSDQKEVEQTYDSKYKLPEEEPSREGYTFGGWYTQKDGAGESVTEETDVKMTQDTTYYAKWTPLDDITITYLSESTEKGTVSRDSESHNPVIGTFLGAKAAPEEGYRFVKWMLTNDPEQKAVGDEPEFVPAKVDGKYVSASYTAVFERLKYDLVSSVDGQGGSISPSGTTSVEYGKSQTYTFTADKGYEVKAVTVDNNPVAIGDSYTFQNIKEPHTIQVQFQKKEYTITATAGENGTITPIGDTKVLFDETKTFIITPDQGYEVKEITVDNKPVAAADIYTFSKVDNDHTIHVEFEKEEFVGTFTLTLNKDNTPWNGENISILPQGGTDFIPMTGTEGVYTAEVKDGTYTIYKGEESTGQQVVIQGKDGSITLDYYTLTLKKDKGIATIPTGGVYLAGESVSASGLTEDQGYTFRNWASSDTNLLKDQTGKALSFAMPKGTLTLTAKADADMHTATFDADGGTFKDHSTLVEKEQTYDSKYVIPGENPGKDGYTFEGWFTQKDGAGETVSEDTDVKMTQDTTYYAKWTPLGDVTISYSSESTEKGTVSQASESGNPVIGSFSGATATPKEGHEFVKWIVTGDPEQKTVSDKALLVPVKADGKYVSASYTAIFKKLAYDITSVVNGDGGKISPSGTVIVEYGESQTYTFVPDAGYRVKEVLVDGSKQETDQNNSYTFESVNTVHTISVSFERSQFTITSQAGAHGAISPAGNTTVAAGKSATYVFAPEEGYRIKTVTVDGKEVELSDSYTFTDVKDDHEIQVEFELKQFNITAAVTGNTGGTVSPSGSNKVNYGEDISYSMTPQEGYELDQILVDGEPVDNSNTYQFKHVTADHTLDVRFKKKVYSIEASVSKNGGGSITSEVGEDSVEYGGSKTYQITPDKGYKIKEVIVDGVAQEEVKDTYTFENVKKNGHSITVVFEKETYTITSKAGDNGSITPSGEISVAYGESKTYKMTPKSGYKVKDVVVDGKSVGAVTSYTFDKTEGNHTISVVFEKKSSASSTPKSTGSGNSGTSKTSKVDKYVKTGDETNLGWFVVALVSLLGSQMLPATRKKRQR